MAAEWYTTTSWPSDEGAERKMVQDAQSAATHRVKVTIVDQQNGRWIREKRGPALQDVASMRKSFRDRQI